MKSTVKMGYAVTHEIRVFDKDGKQIEHRPPQKNMVTDIGLDMLATISVTEVATFLHIGTGTLATHRASDPITVTVVGTTATASAPFFEGNDVALYRELVFADGTRRRMTSYTSTTEVEIDSTTSQTAQLVTVYNTEQQALETQLDVFDDVLSGASHNYSIFSEHTGRVTGIHARHYTSPAIVAGATISEIGMSPDGVIDNLFARWVPEDPIVVPAGGSFTDLISVLDIVDTSETTLVAPVTNITGDAVGAIVPSIVQATNRRTIDTDGTVLVPAGDENFVSEPYTHSTVEALTNLRADTDSSTDFTKTALTGTSVEVAGTLQPYVSFSFSREMTGIIATDALPTGWYSLGLTNNSENEWVYRMKWDSVPTVALGRALTIRIIKTWGRI